MKRLSRWFFYMALSTGIAIVAMGFAKSAPLLTSSAVSAAINKELPVGSSSAAIESFFERHQIVYGWDRISCEYQGVIRRVGPFRGISITVYVDSQRRFVRAEVEDTFIAP